VFLVENQTFRLIHEFRIRKKEGLKDKSEMLMDISVLIFVGKKYL